MYKRKKHSMSRINELVRNSPGRRIHTAPAFASFLNIPNKSNTSLWFPSMNKPATAFWGDSDRDGIYNGLDCAPKNRRKQGPEHLSASASIASSPGRMVSIMPVKIIKEKQAPVQITTSR